MTPQNLDASCALVGHRAFYGKLLPNSGVRYDDCRLSGSANFGGSSQFGIYSLDWLRDFYYRRPLKAISELCFISEYLSADTRAVSVCQRVKQ